MNVALQRMEKKMNSTVAIYNNQLEADGAVKELQKEGFDMKKLSVMAKDFHSEEQVVGYYNTGERIAYWGKLDAFWSGLWSLLSGSAFFFVPGIGPVVVGGPIIGAIVMGLEGAVFARGSTALGAAFFSMGIPREDVFKYEISLRTNKFILIAHGTTEEVEQAQKILIATSAEETALYYEEKE